MLYDPKWEVKTKPDVFSLESLIAWLEKQPAAQEYSWADPRECLIGQWLESNGLTGEALGTLSCSLGGYQEYGVNPFFDIALGKINECTFGAALERARAALSAL